MGQIYTLAHSFIYILHNIGAINFHNRYIFLEFHWCMIHPHQQIPFKRAALRIMTFISNYPNLISYTLENLSINNSKEIVSFMSMVCDLF